MESIKIMWFCRNGWTLVEFLDFHLGFGFMKFQITNSSVMEWFWMSSMLILEVLWNGEVG